MPAKQVFQHECDRCHRPWFADAEKPSSQFSVTMVVSTDMVPLHGKFSTLCDSCEKTVANAVQMILKPMKKNSPTKSGAKKKAPVSPLPEPIKGSAASQAKTSGAGKDSP